MKRLIPILLLLVASCGPIWGEEEVIVEPIDQVTIRVVVKNLLSSITEKYEEFGPKFMSRLEAMKDEAAVLEGFESWADFKLGLKATDSKLEVEVAGRITAHMNSLLTPEEENE